MLKSKNKITTTLGVGLFIAGIMLLSSNYLNQKIDNAYSYMNNLLLVEEEIPQDVEIEEVVDNQEETTSSTIKEPETKTKTQYVDPYLNYYIGTLEIPKINLKKGFVDIDSKYNTVSRNVQIVKGSSYPDVSYGNFILAAHSGNSYLAYFKNLYKLELGDIASITYKNHYYTYKIVNIYQQEKTGQVAIYRDTSKNCLTLITCTKDNKTKQTIYILELVDIK